MRTVTARRRSLTLTGAVLLGLGLGVSPAVAGPALAAPTATAIPDAVELSWDGEEFAPTTTETFFGLPVAVPGDSATRTLTIRNAGPSAGVLTADLTDLVTSPEGDPVFADLTLTWDGGSSSFAELVGDPTRLLELPLAQGATTTITLTYAFPLDSSAGNFSDGQLRRETSFDLVVTLAGESPTTRPTPTVDPPPPPLPPTTTPTASATPTATPGTATPGSASPTPTAPAASQQPSPSSTPKGALSLTGADLSSAVGIAVVLLVGGGLGLAVRRRRERRDAH